MSARQPFVPQQRPPSRQTTSVSTSDVKATPDDTFKPNGLLLDSAPGGHEQQTSVNTQHRGVSDIASFVNKPLNLAGFSKKKPHNVALPFITPSKSFGDDVTRSRSPNPRPGSQPMRISMPSPFFPSNSGFTPVSTFRKAQAPTSGQALHPAPSTDDFNASQAHIPAKPPGLDHLDDVAGPNMPQQPGVASNARMRSSSRPSLEKIHEVAEEEENIEQYDSRRTHADNHDSLDMYRSSSSPIPEDNRPNQVDASYNRNPGYDRDGPTKPPLRRVQKRFLRPDEVEDTAEYGNRAKKLKTDMDNEPQVNNRTLSRAYTHL